MEGSGGVVRVGVMTTDNDSNDVDDGAEEDEVTVNTKDNTRDDLEMGSPSIGCDNAAMMMGAPPPLLTRRPPPCRGLPLQRAVDCDGWCSGNSTAMDLRAMDSDA